MKYITAYEGELMGQPPIEEEVLDLAKLTLGACTYKSRMVLMPWSLLFEISSILAKGFEPSMES